MSCAARDADTDSVNSDSSDDAKPVIKKKRSTRTVRGIASNPELLKPRDAPVLESKSESAPGGIYSGKVSSCMTALRAGTLETGVSLPTLSDDEEDFVTLYKEKKKNTNPRKGVRRNGKENGKAGTSAGQDGPTYVLDDSDEDTNLNSSQLSNKSFSKERERSPTPPPSPSKKSQRKRRRKQPKAVKSAMSNLERMRSDYQTQKKFNTSANDSMDADVMIIDSVSESPQSITAKVRSRSGIQRFNMNKKETFQGVLRTVASQEGVPEEWMVMFLGDRLIEPYDTPQILNLHVADIIECRISKQAANPQTEDIDSDDPNIIHICIQGHSAKSKMELPIHQNDRLGKILRQYALKKELKFENLTFMFDGEVLQGSETPDSLDMDDGDTIDVNSS